MLYKKTNFQAEKKVIRERILDSAEKIFSKKGFVESTIREITKEAGCNLASVNYHFRGKEGLYLEVFRRHLSYLRDRRVTGINEVMKKQKSSITLKALLRAFADSFVEPLINKGEQKDFMRLMMHEMIEPKLPKKMFADEVAIPTINAFSNAIKTIYPKLENKQIIMFVISIIGQLMQAVHIVEIFREAEDIKLQLPNLSELVDHIVDFSGAGIKAQANQVK